jgi:hypothetical protein
VVERAELREVEHGQRVAVHDQERLIEPVDERQRSGGAERTLLDAVRDAQPVLRAVPEERPEQLPEVADRQDHLVHPGTLHLPQHDFQDRHVADRHQRLRYHRGERGKACPLAARQNDRFHGSCPPWLQHPGQI